MDALFTEPDNIDSREISPAQRIRQMAQPLQDWFAAVRRPLPWREGRDAYRVWVSEIMLQQTRISAVLGYYARFMEELPDIAALAAVPEDRLMKLWQGLGYYSRARNLKRAAEILTAEYGGTFPADYALIRSLPGIGDYTAGAIASIAFDLPEPAVDGNVLRVMARLCGDGSDISKESTKVRYRTLLRENMPHISPGQFNQALMELGETVCLPNGAPQCASCPLRTLCRADAEGRTAELPVRAKGKERRIEERTVYLITFEGRIALHRRPAKGLLAGLWEFPNVLSAEGDPLEAWGIQARARSESGRGKHIFSHIEWHMQSEIVAAATDALPGSDWVWAGKDELEAFYALPAAFQFVLPAAEALL